MLGPNFTQNSPLLSVFQMIEYLIQGKVADAAACVSHTYDPVLAEKFLHKPIESLLYQKVMMKNLIHLVKKNPYLDNPDAANAKTMIEYDELFGVVVCRGSRVVKNFTIHSTSTIKFLILRCQCC